MSDGFFDKLRDFFVGSEQEYDDYSEDEMEASKKTDAHVAVGSRANLAAFPSKNSKDKIEIVVVNVYCPDEAEKSGWCCKIAREIKAKKCVLVSFDEKTDKNVRTRILDFLSGSVFVSGVNSFKISSTAVLYFPSTFVLSRIPGEADKTTGAPRISEPDEVTPEPVLGGSFSDYATRDFR